MKYRRPLCLAVVVFVLLLISITGRGQSSVIGSRTSMVNGVKLHYLTAGHGPMIILIHGHTRVKFKSLEIEELTVKRLRADEVTVSDSLKLPERNADDEIL